MRAPSDGQFPFRVRDRWNFIDAASKRVIVEAARKRWELSGVWMLVEIRFSSLEEQLE